MFLSLSVTQETSEFLPFVLKRLTILKESLDKYFSDLNFSKYDRIN